MREIHYDSLQLTLYRDVLDNGLVVYLLPKAGFQQTFASFTTKYGSIDSQFRLAHQPQVITVPDGIAHFLEHKMFEKERGDVFPEFAKLGASANAFTTFDQTTYLFSSTDHVLENTEVLLNFVQEPWFSEQSVEKEKGIIGQEIRMYDDNPDWQVFFNLLRALYKHHPVHLPIAGTVESIAGITPDILYTCHETFYHPSNMMFFAVGGFHPEALLAHIRKNQAAKSFGPAPAIDRVLPEEPGPVSEPNRTVHLGVSQPRCLMGWKDAKTGLSGPAQLAQEMLTGVVLEALFGKSSDFYHRLMDAGLIDQNFSWEYECAPTYGYSVLGGNTPNPQALVDTVQSLIDEAMKIGVSEEAFERSRRKAIGRFIATLDSPGAVARSFVSYALRGADVFTTIDVLERLTLQQVNDRLREHFAESQRAVSVVLPA